MKITEHFIRQHHEIITLCKRLQECCIEKHIGENANFVHSLQKDLDKTLSLHTRLEETALFPMLKEHKDPEVRKNASRLQEECIPCYDIYRSYQRRYMAPSHIESHPAKYVEETGEIIAILLQRIDKEERELYSRLR